MGSEKIETYGGAERGLRTGWFQAPAKGSAAEECLN